MSFLVGDRVKVIESGITELIGKTGYIVSVDLFSKLAYVVFDDPEMTILYGFEQSRGIGRARAMFFWRLGLIERGPTSARKRKSGFGEFIRRIEQQGDSSCKTL